MKRPNYDAPLTRDVTTLGKFDTVSSSFSYGLRNDYYDNSLYRSVIISRLELFYFPPCLHQWTEIFPAA